MGKWINLDDLPSGRVEWDDIFDAPSIDLVRCKACRHWNEEDHWCNIRDSYGWDYKADDYCSYGEREGE